MSQFRVPVSTSQWAPGPIRARAQLSIWQLGQVEAFATLDEDAEISSLAFSPTSDVLAVALRDGSIKLWDVATNRQITGVRHEAWAREVAFDTSGRYLASVGDDRSTRIWAVPTLRELSRIRYDRDVIGVAFSPTGNRILSLLDNVTTSVSKWRSDDLVEEACRRLLRNLTAEEWQSYLPNEAPHKTCPNLP